MTVRVPFDPWVTLENVAMLWHGLGPGAELWWEDEARVTLRMRIDRSAFDLGKIKALHSVYALFAPRPVSTVLDMVRKEEEITIGVFERLESQKIQKALRDAGFLYDAMPHSVRYYFCEDAEPQYWVVTKSKEEQRSVEEAALKYGLRIRRAKW